MNVLRQASLFALLTLILGCVPLVMAVVYVIRPTERHLALMRPLSLAGLFASIAGSVLGFINVLRLVWTRELTAETYRVIAIGSAESLVPTLVGFASLTTAWLLVAVGMRRWALMPPVTAQVIMSLVPHGFRERLKGRRSPSGLT